MVTRQNKCFYTIFHVSNSIIIFVIKYIQSVYYVTFTRFYNIPLYCAKMFIYVQIKRTRSDIITTCTTTELFVISGSYLFAILTDNRLVLWRQKKKRERVSLYHRDQYASDLLKHQTYKYVQQLLISLLIIKGKKKYSRSIFTIFSRHLFTEEGNFDARYFQIITGERFKLTKSSSWIKNVLFRLYPSPSLRVKREKKSREKNETSFLQPLSSFEFIHYIRTKRRNSPFV